MKYNKLYSIGSVFLAAAVVLAGCGKYETGGGEAGGPVTFRAAVGDRPDGFTRATTENTWNGMEEIAVRIGLKVKKYRVTADGTMSVAPGELPYYWSGPQMQVNAWYSGAGYSSTEPAEITVYEDQSGANYQKSDFLFAGGEVSLSNPTLVFAHKTVKVVLNVRAADGRAVQGVSLSNMATRGVWNKDNEAIDRIIGGGDKTIVPATLTAAAGFDASYAALLIPQDMTGKALVRLTVDGEEYTYTPKAGEAVWDGGKCYTYNVTAVRNGITVEPVGAGDWNDAGSEDVGSRIEYSAADLKPGDYYYADGTWSDGGLRVKHSDGTLEWEAVKPAPEPGKTVIAIVFQTDPSRISAAEKKLFADAGKPLHGVAMSVMAAGWGSTYYWYYNSSLQGTEIFTRDESVEDPAYPGHFLPENNDAKSYARSFELSDADINGYFNTQVIKVRRAADFAAGYYPAFSAAEQFWHTAGGPAGNVFTSDWYLPSAGQWLDYIRNIGGLALGTTDMKGYNDGAFYWYLPTGKNVAELLNNAMSKIPAGQKTTYDLDSDFNWTSTASSSSEARDIFFRSNGYITSMPYSKDVDGHVRAALAF